MAMAMKPRWVHLLLVVALLTEAFQPCRRVVRNPLLLSALPQENDDFPLPATLPVFPLRKSVKLPTETLTLNLYEERYLAMSDFIADNDTKVFGAIYGSDKPQMVAKGVAPIVPLYQPGDIGTVFSVEEFEEETTMGERKVRIWGVGIGRFRIERILHNGYGGGEAMEEEPLPFLLVQPSRVQDVTLSGKEKDLFLTLQRQLQEVIVMEEGEASINEEDNDKGADTSKFTARDFWQGHSPMHDTTQNLDPAYLQELFSFAAIVSLLPEAGPKEMLTALRMTNSWERLLISQEALEDERR